MSVDYTLDAEDVAAARLLAIGIRPGVEFALFAGAMALMLALSVSPWRFGLLPLLIGLTASLGAFRLMQISKVREGATAAFRRNPTLRQPTTASWSAAGITIQPAYAAPELIAWSELQPLRESERIVLLRQKTGMLHAVPKRAFADKSALAAFRRLALAATGSAR
jgi:hypothetical protein